MPQKMRRFGPPQPGEVRLIEGDRPGGIDIDDIEGGIGQPPFSPLANRSTFRFCWGKLATAPQARPLEAQIRIRRIVDPIDFSGAQGRGQSGPPDGQQRPQQAAMPVLDLRRHPGQAVGTAPSRRPHGDRFGLVISVVSNKEMEDSVSSASLKQELVAGGSCSLLKACHWLGAAPGEYVGCDAMSRQ